MQKNTLKVIAKRAEFYRDNFRLLINVSLSSILLNIILFVSLLFIYNNTKNYYISVDANGSINTLNLSEKPHLTDEMVVNWVGLHIPGLYRLDFLNYKDYIRALKPLFTEHGWQEFNHIFPKVVKQITENKYISNAALSSVPVVTATGVIDGVQSWQLEVPVLISFTKGESAGSNKIILKITVKQNNDHTTIQRGQLFGIEEIIQLNP